MKTFFPPQRTASGASPDRQRWGLILTGRSTDILEVVNFNRRWTFFLKWLGWATFLKSNHLVSFLLKESEIHTKSVATLQNKTWLLLMDYIIILMDILVFNLSTHCGRNDSTHLWQFNKEGIIYLSTDWFLFYTHSLIHAAHNSFVNVTKQTHRKTRNTNTHGELLHISSMKHSITWVILHLQWRMENGWIKKQTRE